MEWKWLCPEGELAEEEQNDVGSDRFGLTPEDYREIDNRGAAFLQGQDHDFVEVTREKLSQTMASLESHISVVEKARGKRQV
ncbi:hypothetical protein [Nioella aestuarii]|uniref:hypothetical protein n=1 Tax=Nioella aestuarii TaxID=1662864 RepID=UPI003D7F31FB